MLPNSVSKIFNRSPIYNDVKVVVTFDVFTQFSKVLVKDQFVTFPDTWAAKKWMKGVSRQKTHKNVKMHILKKASRNEGISTHDNKLRQVIRVMIQKELKEISTTGGVAGFNTPRAFSDDEDDLGEEKIGINGGKVRTKEGGNAGTVSGYVMVEGAYDKAYFALSQLYQHATQAGKADPKIIRESDKYYVILRKFINTITEHKSINENFRQDSIKVAFDVMIKNLNKDDLIWVEGAMHSLEGVWALDVVRKSITTSSFKKTYIYNGSLAEFDILKSEFIDILDQFEKKHQAKFLVITKKINENRWLNLKNDESLKPVQKIGIGIRNMNKQLKEVEDFVRWYKRLQVENDVTTDVHWKRTHRNVRRMKERIIRIANDIREIK